MELWCLDISALRVGTELQAFSQNDSDDGCNLSTVSANLFKAPIASASQQSQKFRILAAIPSKRWEIPANSLIFSNPKKDRKLQQIRWFSAIQKFGISAAILSKKPEMPANSLIFRNPKIKKNVKCRQIL